MIDADAIKKAKVTLDKIEREVQETLGNETDDSERRPAKREKRVIAQLYGCETDVSTN